jgi:aromatic ring-cleaving dioxygenase
LFSRVYFDDAYAILVATIRDQIRVGVVKLFLLEKTKMGWRKKEEYVLEVW